MEPIHELQAEVCRVLAHPARIALLHLLAESPREVGRLAEALELGRPNVSQHLAVMRATGLVESERDGRGIVYRLTDPEVITACDAMADVMRRRLSRMADLAASIGTTTSPTTSRSRTEVTTWEPSPSRSSSSVVPTTSSTPPPS